MDDETADVVLIEIGGRKVMMFADELDAFEADQDEYGEAIVDVDERGFARWVPRADILPDGPVYSA